MNESNLGDFLRTEREKRGITIEQVASATKISVRLLQSLEADQFADLPAKPFVRGFVISYSRFVGIDSNDVLTRFGGYIEKKGVERPTQEEGHSGYAFEKRDTERSRTMLWIVMGSFVVIGGLVIFVLKPALKHRPVPKNVAKLQTAARKKGAVTTEEGEKKVVPDKRPVIATKDKGTPAKGKKKQESSTAAVATPTTATPPPPVAEAQSVTADAAKKPAEPAATAAEAALADPTQEEKKFVSADPNRVPAEEDKLQKGDALSPDRIRHRIVLKSLEDVWVRYRIDGNDVMKFKLLKDKVLVFRSEEVIRAQVSNVDAVQFRVKWGKYQPLANAKGMYTFNDTATLIFPDARARENLDPFPGLKPLPATPGPPQEEE